MSSFQGNISTCTAIVTEKHLKTHHVASSFGTSKKENTKVQKSSTCSMKKLEKTWFSGLKWTRPNRPGRTLSGPPVGQCGRLGARKP